MTHEKRLEIQEQLFKQVLEISKTKGRAYAGENDTLANFKEVATSCGLTAFQVWQVYFSKHVLAINKAIAKDPKYPVEETESMEGRIEDAVNYLSILLCLLKEVLEEDYEDD